MDSEKAIEIINKTETDTDIKNRKFKGLKLLSKFVDEFEFAAGDDTIYVCDFDSVVEKMSQEDVITLARYGYMEDEDSWAFFT